MLEFGDGRSRGITVGAERDEECEGRCEGDVGARLGLERRERGGGFGVNEVMERVRKALVNEKIWDNVQEARKLTEGCQGDAEEIKSVG